MIAAEDQEIFVRGVMRAFAAEGDNDRQLADLGWWDAFNEWGGPALVAVLSEQGRTLATSTVLDDVLVRSLRLDESCGVLLPVPGAATAPGSVQAVGDRAQHSVCMVSGLGTRRVDDTGSAIVVAEEREGVHLATVVPMGLLTSEPLGGIDPDSGLRQVTGSVLLAELPDGVPVPWADAVAVGRVATAAELVGISRAMLQLAVEHAKTRVQFDRPIAGFQAVRHRLADALVAIEGAASATAAAAESIGHDRVISQPHTAVAKALAGHAARLTAQHCQQVLAGIGFTAEYPFHRHLRRVLRLDELWTPARTLNRELGRQTLASGRLPIDLQL